MYFRDARNNPALREQYLAHSRYARNANLWLAVLFAIFAIGPAIYAWSTGTHAELSGVAGAGCLITFLTANHLKERIAMLRSFEEMPNQSSDPTPASVTPAAGQPPRQP